MLGRFIGRQRSCARLSRHSIILSLILLFLSYSGAHSAEAQAHLTKAYLTAYSNSVAADLYAQGYCTQQIINSIEEARKLLCDGDIPGPTELYRQVLLRLEIRLADETCDEVTLTDEMRLAMFASLFEPVCPQLSPFDTP